MSAHGLRNAEALVACAHAGRARPSGSPLPGGEGAEA